MSHVTRHTSHVTHHTSHVTRYTSHVTRHTSHVTPSARQRALSQIGLHHKTLVFTVGGCALPDDVANDYIFTDLYNCSRQKKRGQSALILDEVLTLLR